MWLEQSLKNANTKESTSDIFIQWLCTSKAPTKTQVEHGYHMLSMLLLRFCALSNKITLATVSKFGYSGKPSQLQKSWLNR
jgi:hypothetical protein